MRIRIWFLWVICLLGTLAWAQPGANPFDLSPRLPQEVQDAAQQARPLPQAQPLPGNPFDLVAPTAAVLPREVAPAPKKPALKLAPKQAEFPAEQYRKFLFGVVMVTLLWLTLLTTLFRPVFTRVYHSVFNDQMLGQIYREREAGGGLPFFIVYSLFFVVGGLLLFLVLRHFGRLPVQGHVVAFGLCVGAVFAALLAKHLVLSMLGAIFPLRRETGMYSFVIMAFGIFLGLLMLPVALMLAYGPPEWHTYVLYVGGGIAVVVYLLRAVRGLFVLNKYLLSHKFHFLLYLCAVEIGPGAVLYRLFAG